MSDYPNLKLVGRTVEEITSEVQDIRKWYADYKGDKTIRLVDVNKNPIGYVELESVESEIRNGTINGFIKKHTEQSPHAIDKELVGKLADGHTSKSMRSDKRKNNKDNTFSKNLFRKKQK